LFYRVSECGRNDFRLHFLIYLITISILIAIFAEYRIIDIRMKDKLEMFLNWFNLRSELEDYDAIHENIEKGIVFKGTNLWILVLQLWLRRWD